MELKDYLHLYWGCDCICSLWDLPGGDFITKIGGLELQIPRRVKKLILRPLSDMTEEEKQSYRRFMRAFSTNNILPVIKSGHLINEHHSRASVEATVWLLRQGFDLFGLIDAGLAIDAKEVENAK